MSADEWETNCDPFMMLRSMGLTFFDLKPSRRKLELFACACIGSVEEVASSSTFQTILDAAERKAEEIATSSDLAPAISTARRIVRSSDSYLASAVVTALTQTPPHSLESVLHDLSNYGYEVFGESRLDLYSSLLRCIVCNPFRPVTPDPSWLTSTVVALARGIYDDRAFDRLPILADALQDAGCDHPDILGHCRGDGPHARGCWVVDLVLGKS